MSTPSENANQQQAGLSPQAQAGGSPPQPAPQPQQNPDPNMISAQRAYAMPSHRPPGYPTGQPYPAPYPTQGGYPPQPGYPPQAGYPPQGYAPYPHQQGGYPPQPGYPPQGYGAYYQPAPPPYYPAPAQQQTGPTAEDLEEAEARSSGRYFREMLFEGIFIVFMILVALATTYFLVYYLGWGEVMEEHGIDYLHQWAEQFPGWMDAIGNWVRDTFM